MYGLVLLYILHTHRLKRAIEKVKSDKSSILPLFFVFKRRQIEKHSYLALYIMKTKLTYQLQEEKREKDGRRKRKEKNTTDTQNENGCRMEGRKTFGCA